MILTSSQVSVAASSGIVLFFTTALFVSGCIIQQRTLRDLREVVRVNAHPPKPKIFLPDRFRQTTTELDDGTIVAVDDGSDQHLSGPDALPPAVVEIKPSAPGRPPAGGHGSSPNADAPQPPPGTPPEIAIGGAEEPPQKPIDRAERRRLIREEMRKLAQVDTRDRYRRGFW